MKNIIIIVLVSIFVLISCQDKKNNTKSLSNEKVLEDLKIDYAKLFKIKKFENYTEIACKSVNYSEEIKYYLAKKGSKVPDEILPNVIFTPVKKVVCLSTTHIAFIDILGKTDAIRGISGLNYVYTQNIRQRIESKQVVDVGYEQNLDFELLIKMKPDVVFAYQIDGKISTVNSKLEKLGIKVVIVNEYLEQKILGQTEWIKFFAEFFDLQKQSVEYFTKISDDYLKLQQLTKNISEKPSVLVNLPWKGTWYIAGGKSNVAEMISDAGGNYLWKNDESSENLASHLEAVFNIASEADYWLNTGQANTKTEILSTDERLMNFKALKKDKVYNRNARLNSFGGNDFMESGIVRPDLILKDLIYIFHPDKLPNHQLYYYKKVE